MADARILLVEDEPDLCVLLQRFLRRSGYEADIAGAGLEAWEIVQSASHRYNIYLIDLTLPDLAGEEFARRVLQLQPSAILILTSGSVYDVSRLANGSARVAFLQKPFLPKRLLETIAKTMA